MRRNRKHEAAVRAARPHYAALLEAQGGRCAICGKEPREGQRPFHIDTDHRKGHDYAVRGLLCFHCNMALPRIATPAWLARALAYMIRYELRRARGEALLTL